VGPNPTDRGKPGVKQSILVEVDGGPLAITIAGANIPDAQLLEATIDAVVLERPEPEPDFPQHLCLDKGYDNDTGWETAIDADYTPHIAMIRDETKHGAIALISGKFRDSAVNTQEVAAASSDYNFRTFEKPAQLEFIVAALTRDGLSPARTAPSQQASP